MDLDGLLKANIELQKRIATDRALRRKLAMIEGAGAPSTQGFKPESSTAPGLHKITFSLPVEMCGLLVEEAERAGKTPSEIIEKSFAEYYKRKHGSEKHK